jgi:hypothetical protein
MSHRNNPIKINKELSKPMDLMNVGFVGVVGSAGGVKVTQNNAQSTYTDSGKTYYKYTQGGTITFNGDGDVKLMLIGGGASGCVKYYGGGSGAGGMYYDDVTITSQQYTITVGGSNTDSTALGKTAIKGGRGQNIYNSGTQGGCGGGAKYGDGTSSNANCADEQQSGSASGGIGFDGGNGTANPTLNYAHSGGGGGLGQIGGDGTSSNPYGQCSASNVIGSGGNGRTNAQLDNILTITSSGVGGYIGGGGGAARMFWNTGSGGQGGLGGGGASGLTSGSCGTSPEGGSGVSGTSYTGSGAGAAGRAPSNGTGGSGICIIVVG